ncbi:MAG: sterol desaturase family protein, partial [Nitrospinota bacterium]|nr:sterol desaturase family protein [Nitrospinota bacterium]
RFIIFLTVFLLMLGLEGWIPRHPTVDSKRRRLGINLTLTGIDILVAKLLLGAAAMGAAGFAQEKGWGLLNGWTGPQWLELIIAVVVLDFMIYLQHVVVHKVPMLWRFHVVHHSDLDLDVSSGLRFHPVEILISMLYKMGIVLVLGPSLFAVLVFEAILNGMAQFSHSNIKLPLPLDHALRWVIVTPDMHRIHHSVVVNETNSNYGFNLSVWDRWLGTYLQDAGKPQPEILIGIDTFQNREDVSLIKLLGIPFGKTPEAYTDAP